MVLPTRSQALVLDNGFRDSCFSFRVLCTSALVSLVKEGTLCPPPASPNHVQCRVFQAFYTRTPNGLGKDHGDLRCSLD